MSIHTLANKETMAFIKKVAEKYHAELIKVDVRLDVLMVSNEEDTPCLKLHGVPAAATIKILSEKQRAKKNGDVEIVIDMATWNNFSVQRQEALIDHELYLEADGIIKKDAHNRPKLKMKPHDVEFGWFDEVARRHGIHAMEVRQAHDLMVKRGQVYFPFMKDLRVREDLDDTSSREITFVMPRETAGPSEDLIAKAIEIIRETKRASTSSLQRRLKIKYTEASDIMDALEARKIVGPANGNDPREILIDLEAA